MNLVSCEQITKSFGERYLFQDASFYLNTDEKIGILGLNGTGKSTLLKMIAGLEQPDQGTITRANNLVIRYLPQHPVFNENHTVLESVIAPYLNSENQTELENTAKTMMTKLGISDFTQKTGELSGGQKKRTALVSVLLTPADILILDEPTNHLDQNMAQWLEDTLKKWRGAFIMVTHDRYFLDRVSNRIVEIDHGSIYSYQTNYSGFLKLKEERAQYADAAERKRQSILRKEIEWMQRGARARTTKQKAHIQRYEALVNQQTVEKDQTIELSSVHTRMGKTTVELSKIGFAYDTNNLFSDFTYIFLKNDRIGFIGDNGCGKTTLMKIIAGRLQPSKGSVLFGQTIKTGYYSQEFESGKEAGIAYMNPQLRVIDYIRETAEYVKTKDGSISASQMLERFLFPSQEQYNKIEKLSGGEKRRLNLLRVLMEAPNVLILDEPTNDLDIQTLTVLEDYLDDFDGIMIAVSHDRYFLDRTVRRIFAFEDHKIVQYEGNYSDYFERKQNDHPEDEDKTRQKDTAVKVEKTWGGEKKLKFSFQEQKDYDCIEEEIGKLEDRLQAIDQEMEQQASDFIRLNELSTEKDEKELLLNEKMKRWMYLEDLNERIQEERK